MSMTLTEGIECYLDHARAYYVRADGTPTGQAVNLELALRPLRGRRQLRNFRGRHLLAYRDDLVERGLSKSTVNQWVGWVRGFFRWLAQRKKYSASAFAELVLVDPIKRPTKLPTRLPRVLSRTELVAVQAVVSPVVRRLLEAQWWTGMRPGELVRLTASQLVEVDGVTVYVPRQHKTLHLERTRVVPLCSAAVDALGDLDAEPLNNSNGRPYTTDTFGQAVRRACARACVKSFSPGLIRRTVATRVRRLVGCEAAQRLLGHASSQTTERYLDLELIDAVETLLQLQRAGWGQK